jgi:hypothetical protein
MKPKKDKEKRKELLKKMTNDDKDFLINILTDLVDENKYSNEKLK